ncbi:MAG: molybdopterin cofactor-binding domain-containing protein [Nocardioidaceae bacterium]
MTATATPSLPRDLVANPTLSRWVTVDADGTIGVRVGKVELGQGILTALAQIAADALDVPLSQVRMLSAHTTDGPDEGMTSGSMSIVDAGPSVRVACGNVRALFVGEAARGWEVEADQVTVEGGRIRTVDASRTTTYGELADRVSLDVPVSAEVPATSPGGPRLVGTSVARLDLPDKVVGRPAYIGDLRLPGQLVGRVVRPPSVGARLVSVDEAATAELSVEVVRDGSFLGVVGADETEVERAVRTLRRAADWDEADHLPDENELPDYLKAGPHESIPVVAEDRPQGATRRLRASFSRPFLAHASMAPSCGVARWDADGSLTVWSHSQGIHRLRDAIAQVLDLDVATVVVEHAENAGCYGHNGADDAAFDAVLLARAVPGRPVAVQWSRADELTWAPFGSAMAATVEADVDDTGQVHSWTYDVWSQGHTSRPGSAGAVALLGAAQLSTPLAIPAAIDPPTRRGGGTTRNSVPIYQVGPRRITGHRLLETPIRSSALRSLGSFFNVFCIESFMDELAAEVGQDPLEYRLGRLGDERGRAVLERAATAAGWGDSMPEDVGRGIGFARYKDSEAYCAVVAEVEAGQEIRLRRLTIAADVGRVVNPDGTCNQLEGGATQAASWTLKERVRFDRRRVTSDDWESYPILRFSEVPEIDVHLIDRPDLPSVGAGEAAQGPTAGAIGNAVAAAVGVRVRDLPLTTDAVVAAIEAD